MGGMPGMALLEVDGAGMVARWGAAAEAMFGWSSGEAAGKLLAALFADGAAPECGSACERWMLRRDGTRFLAEALAEPRAGGPGLVMAVRDLGTARLEAERQAALLDAASDGVYALDADWRLTDMNSAAERHLELRREDIVGRTLFETFPTAAGSPFEQLLKDVMRDGRAVAFDAPSPVAARRSMEVRVMPRPGGGAIASFTDITPRRAVEQRLLESARRLHAALEIADMAEWSIDVRTGAVQHGEHLARIYGYPPGHTMAARQEECLELVHPDDRARVDAETLAGLEADGRYETEYRIVRADGSIGWVSTRGRVIRDSGGDLRLEGVTRDVTPRREAEKAAEANAEALRLARAAGGTGAWSVDPATGETWWSAEARALFGVGRDMRVSREFWQALVHPNERDATRAFIAKVRAERWEEFEHELHIVRPDGGERWLLTRGRRTGGPDGRVAGLVIDVTALKRAERDAEATRAQLQAIYDNVPVGIIQAEAPSGRVLAANRAAETIMRSTLAPPADRGEYGEWAAFRADGTRVRGDEFPLARVLDTGKPCEGLFQFERGDGTRAWLRTQAAPIRDGNGAMTGALVAITDVDVLVTLQEALTRLTAELESRVEAAIRERDRAWNNSRDLAVVLDRDGVVEAVNPAWTATLGWTAAETVGRSVLEFLSEADVDAASCSLARAAEAPLDAFENHCLCKGGGDRLIEWVTTPEGGRIYGSGRDVTEERRQRAALQQAEAQMHEMRKVETLGQLTGGVAHDFNNLLTPIMGGIDLLARRLHGDPGAHRIAAAAMQSAERAKTLIQRLLAFGRRQALAPRAVDLAGLLEGMRDLLARSVGASVSVSIEAQPGLPAVRVDPNQLELAILNLAVNARDAMPDGGTLRLEAVPAAEAPGPGPGSFVALRVVDSGAGMDAETLARATEPFFTTKEAGHGTGLGLSMVFGLAAQSGGAFDLRSAPGAGTTATLWLPAAGEAAETAPDQPEPSLREHSGRVLLVDDEPLVRATIADGLRAAGYTVAEAGTPESAVHAVRGGAVPDVVVTDQMMPGMTGAQLAEELRLLVPGLPVLVITGYSAPGHEGLAGLPVLAKPFRVDQLSAAIDALLAA